MQLVVVVVSGLRVAVNHHRRLEQVPMQVEAPAEPRRRRKGCGEPERDRAEPADLGENRAVEPRASASHGGRIPHSRVLSAGSEAVERFHPSCNRPRGEQC